MAAGKGTEAVETVGWAQQTPTGDDRFRRQMRDGLVFFLTRLFGDGCDGRGCAVLRISWRDEMRGDFHVAMVRGGFVPWGLQEVRRQGCSGGQNP